MQKTSFLKIETIWSSEVNKAIPEQVKVVVNVVVLDYDYVNYEYASIF